ncbi:MAG: CRTAC1 family protein [Planctomycetes bacterium]|nr:CRTAC1 family protein [Planctomycetota bacterium]
MCLALQALAALSLLLQASAEAPVPAAGADARRASHARMLAYLAEPARRLEYDKIFIGEWELPGLHAALAALAPGKQAQKRWDLLGKIAMVELRQGKTESAVEHFAEACALLPRLEGKVEHEAMLKTRFYLGLSWLRLGETQNCVARHTSESCLVPIGKGGVHQDQQGSRKAIEVFTALLADAPEDLTARWLLNLAYMTLGEYPEHVPPALVVPPSAFASDEAFPRFVDVAPQLGVNSMTLAGGAIADDFDNDGVFDLVTSEVLPSGQLRLFKGQPDGTFVERTEAANLKGIGGGLNCIQTDYDNDGWLDILVPRGAWLYEQGRVAESLLHNEGDGTFLDVTFAAGLAEANYPTQAVAWADYDNDGDLDLYMANESSPRIDAPSQLFRNEGNGRFVDVAAAAGVLNQRYAKGCCWGDYDGDRYPDLYVSNLGDDRLYHNKRDGTFEDVAARLSVLGPERSFPVWFFDYDNDGALDLYVSSYWTKVGPYVLDLLGGQSNAELARLFRGDGHGGFRDVTREVGLTDISITMGANFGDLDDDGFLDFYLSTGFPDYEALVPNRMYWNRGGKRFADVTTNGGFGHLQKGHGVAFADLDRDGDTDVFAEMGGAFPGDAFGNALFQNPGFGRHWIEVQALGVKSNRAGIGARIRCEVSENGVKRSIYRHVNSGGSFGANPLRQHLGLGSATRIDVLEIYWPTSDLTQTFRDVAVDARVRITEGVDELRPIP